MDSSDTIAASNLLQIDIEQHTRGSVYRLTVARPKKLNVLNTAALIEMLDALTRISDDDTARAVILCGSGNKAWIGGADLNEWVALDGGTARAFITQLHRVCLAIRT